MQVVFPEVRLRMGCCSLQLSLTKHSACFLCLPVDGPPMEPSQFVSVVPKYPDKMGFDEVGKVSVSVCTCMCAHVHVVFICLYQNNKPGHMSESARAAWLPKRNLEKVLSFCCALFTYL